MLLNLAIAALSLATGGFAGYRLKKFDIAAVEQRIANYRGWVKRLEAELAAVHDTLASVKAAKK